ncbi:hypothetical protein Tco_0025103 [Tanacetum coccineum]
MSTPMDSQNCIYLIHLFNACKILMIKILIDSAAGGKLLTTCLAECLKSSRASPKVRSTRAKAGVAQDIVPEHCLRQRRNQAYAPAPAPAPCQAVESKPLAANYKPSKLNFRPQWFSIILGPSRFPTVKNSQANNAYQFQSAAE